LKRFGTAEKILKNRDGKGCPFKRFETADKLLKTKTVNGEY